MRRTFTIATTIAAIVALLPGAASASHLDQVALNCDPPVAGLAPGSVRDLCQAVSLLLGPTPPADVRVSFSGEPVDSTETAPTLGESTFTMALGTPLDVSEPFTLAIDAGHTADITAPRGLTVVRASQDGVFTGTSFPNGTIEGALSLPNQGPFRRVVPVSSTGTFTLNFRSGGGGPTDPDNSGNFTGSIELGTELDISGSVMADGVEFMYSSSRDWGVTWYSANRDGVTTVALHGGVPGLPFSALGQTSFVGSFELERALGHATNTNVSLLGETFPLRLFEVTVDQINLATGTIKGTAPPSTDVTVFATSDTGDGFADTSANASGVWSTTFSALGIAPNPSSWAAIDAFSFDEHGHAAGAAVAGRPVTSPNSPFARLDVEDEKLIRVSGLSGRDGDAFGFTIAPPSGTPFDGDAALMVNASGFFVGGELLIPLTEAPPGFDPLGGFDLEVRRGGGAPIPFDFPAVTTSYEDGVATIRSVAGADLGLFGTTRTREFDRYSPSDADGRLAIDTRNGDATSAYVTADVFTGDVSVVVPVFDGALMRPLGASGGPAYPGRPYLPTPGGLWSGSGGPADLAAFFGYTPRVGALPDGVNLVSGDEFRAAFEVRIFANGAFTRIPPVPTDLVISVTQHFSDADDLFVGGWGPHGWETIGPDKVIRCIDFSQALPPECGLHPGPHLFVDDVPHLTTFAVTEGNPAGPTLDIARAAGPDRIDTAIELSKASFVDGAADAVIVARDRAFPDALSSVPVAAAANGPVLLNPVEGLDGKVRDEIARLGATTAYIMGETAAQSQAVQDALVDLLGAENVIRLGGADRFETAEKAAVAAQELWQDAGFADAGTSVLVAKGIDVDETRAWPDALAGGQLAAAARMPILLTRSDSVPVPTNRAIDTLDATRVTVLGGPAAVPEETLAQLGGAGTDRDRIGGEDRFHTSTLVAHAAIGAGATDRDVFVATGRNYPDGLAAGAAAAARGGTLVLVDDDQLAEQSKFTADWLAERNEVTRWVRVAGGEVAIVPAVFEDIVALLS